MAMGGLFFIVQYIKLDLCITTALYYILVKHRLRNYAPEGGGGATCFPLPLAKMSCARRYQSA